MQWRKKDEEKEEKYEPRKIQYGNVCNNNTNPTQT